MKKRRMKRLIASLLVCLMILGVIPANTGYSSYGVEAAEIDFTDSGQTGTQTEEFSEESFTSESQPGEIRLLQQSGKNRGRHAGAFLRRTSDMRRHGGVSCDPQEKGSAVRDPALYSEKSNNRDERIPVRQNCLQIIRFRTRRFLQAVFFFDQNSVDLVSTNIYLVTEHIF